MKKITMLMMVLAMLLTTAFAQTGKPTTATKKVTTVKKDGTPDRRFKANKNAKTVVLKKDGTPDKRYKAYRKKP